MRNKKKREELGRPIQEERWPTLLETFNPKEIERIHQLVIELREFRKIDKNEENLREKIDAVLEREYFYVCDHIIAEGWTTDKAKIEALWSYLRKQLS